MNIVRIHNDEPRAGTKIIADGFGKRHIRIKGLVDKHRQRFESFGLICGQKIRTKGRAIEEYLLNEDQTMFLGTLLKNSEIVLDFKQNLVKEFSKTRKQLLALQQHQSTPHYQITRDAGKIVRKQTTDEMKRFVAYAAKQGSGSPDKYYMNISTMLNRLLFVVEGKYKNLRNVMTTQQLMTVSSAEQIVDKGLREGMDNNLPYKEIFRDVKTRVDQFAGLHGKSNVISPQMQLEKAMP